MSSVAKSFECLRGFRQGVEKSTLAGCTVVALHLARPEVLVAHYKSIL